MSDQFQVVEISNFLLGMLFYESYGLRIFTQGAESTEMIYRAGTDDIPNSLYLIIAKDSRIIGANGKNVTSMCRLSITKPEYKFQYGYAGPRFKPSDQELIDINQLLCSYNYEGTMPLFAKRFVDPHYTVFTNYIRFLNEMYGRMYPDKWKNLPLDMAVPKWHQNMEESK